MRMPKNQALAEWLDSSEGRVLIEVPIAPARFEEAMRNRIKSAWIAGYAAAANPKRSRTPMPTIDKPLAEWLESSEGLLCLHPPELPLRFDDVVENRLSVAWSAGYEAGLRATRPPPSDQ